eukprot:TRINITY_DN9192_c0_g1_i1.p1 TRINITY_DN9192_c0_g1~~TRINITY_DN9192_c0_g1_i1.p1  ORF type:complete len:750 (+),score=180.22 TRINITY_DN9192_c0_g1_i1:104-2353(+)
MMEIVSPTRSGSSSPRDDPSTYQPLELSALGPSPTLSPRSSSSDLPRVGSSNILGGYQPLCFSKDSFTQEFFKVDAFINDCKTRVPLESVLNDLKEYSVSLDNELLELINKDYADFVNLSSNLVGIDRTVNDLRKPLFAMKDDITTLRSSLDDSINAIESKLKERREIFDKKACLELFINVAKSIAKIEKLLRMDDSTGADHSDGLQVLLRGDEQTSNLIERVASEFNYLNFYVSRGKTFPFVRNMEPRISFIENSLQNGLERLFREGLNSKNPAIISNCLRTYAAIDKISHAESLYRKWVVAPFAQKVITEEAAKSPEGISEMFNQLVRFVEDECSLLLGLTQTSIRGFSFLANSIWPEYAELILQKQSKIFRPAHPDEFHAFFKVSFDFVDRIETMFNSRAEVINFRAQPAYQEFYKRWNGSLPIYFQLRFQKIASKLEASFLEQQLPLTTDKDQKKDDFILKSATELYDCLHKCWSPDIFLQPLSHRMLKLSVQLVLRFKNWVEAGLSVVQQGKEQEHTLASIQLDQWIFVYHDLFTLKEKIPTHYASFVAKQSALPAEMDSVITECFAEVGEELGKTLPSIEEYVESSVLKRCVESLQPLRGIPATYRMTNKPVPTKPSYFVNNIVEPIEELERQLDHLVRTNVKKAWLLKIATSVTERYREMTNELLNSLHKSEEMIRKFKKGPQSAVSGTMTDMDRIYVQLFLDVEAFGSQLEKTHVVNLQSFEPYKQLVQAVSSKRAKEQHE